MSEANKELVRRYQEANDTGDLEVVAEILASDWWTNGWPEGLPQSSEGIEQLTGLLGEVFPDARFETHAIFGDGDLVGQRWTFVATHKNEFMGLPPTGKEVRCDGVSIFEIADGKIVKHWAFADELYFLRELGAEFPPDWMLVGHRTTS